MEEISKLQLVTERRVGHAFSNLKENSCTFRLAALMLRTWLPTPSSSSLLALQSRRLSGIHGDRWPGWQVVIGIEVHAQIRSCLKLFSSEHLAVTSNASVQAMLESSQMPSRPSMRTPRTRMLTHSMLLFPAPYLYLFNGWNEDRKN